MAVIQGALCAAHTHAPAVGTCTRCGSFVCAACATRRRMFVYCPACASRLGSEKPSDQATVAVALGALAVGIYCFPLGIPALILGNREIERINRGEAPEEGRLYAHAARITGWIGIGLTVVVGLIGAAAAFGVAASR